MKSAKLNDVIKWKPDGKLYECVGLINLPAAVLVSLEEKICPHCGNPIGKDEIVSVISSPQFQNFTSEASFEDLKEIIQKLNNQLAARGLQLEANKT